MHCTSSLPTSAATYHFTFDVFPGHLTCTLSYASVRQPYSKQPHFWGNGSEMVLAGRQKLARSVGRKRSKLLTYRRETHAQRRRERQAYQISFTVLFTRILLVLVYWWCVDPRGCKTGSKLIRFLNLLHVKNNHGCSPQFACIFMCSYCYIYSAQDLANKISTYLINQLALKR